jgi:hypothetical protein
LNRFDYIVVAFDSFPEPFVRACMLHENAEVAMPCPGFAEVLSSLSAASQTVGEKYHRAWTGYPLGDIQLYRYGSISSFVDPFLVDGLESVLSCGLSLDLGGVVDIDAGIARLAACLCGCLQ